MVVFRLFEKLRHSNERTAIFSSLPRIEVFGGGKWQNSSSTNTTQNREFVWIGQTGQKIIRVCMEFCNFCKVPIWTIFHRKLLNLVGQLLMHQHFSFNVQIFNPIDTRNSPQCPHVSAMGYCKGQSLLTDFLKLKIFFRKALKAHKAKFSDLSEILIHWCSLHFNVVSFSNQSCQSP